MSYPRFTDIARSFAPGWFAAVMGTGVLALTTRGLARHWPVLALPELTLAFRAADCLLILRRHDDFGVDLYQPKQGDYFMAQDDTAGEVVGQGAQVGRRGLPAVAHVEAEQAHRVRGRGSARGPRSGRDAAGRHARRRARRA